MIELVGGGVCLAMLQTLRPGGLLISAQAAWVSVLPAGEATATSALGLLANPELLIE